MRSFFSRVPACRQTRSGARGFGLLQVLLLIAVMSGLATIGYLQWRERALIESSRQERQVLAQADQALIAFATVNHRLPCPDTNRDGEEDCGTLTDQKGWLPSVTLRLAGADPGVDVGQLRYMVQRGAGDNNLTTLTDSWRPLAYDDAGTTFFNMRGAGYPSDILTLTDLCQRIDTARTTTVSADLARVNASPVRSVAYALAHPGSNDADGDGDLFDGATANGAANTNLMEDPARRPLLATYNDIVLERSFTSLLAAFQCQPLIDSINAVALGEDIVSQVAEMKADNIEAARRAVAFSTLAAIMTSLEIALAVAEGISDAGNAAVEWVTCAASLGLAVNACAAAPQHTVAIGLAGGVVYANIAAVALNATAAGIAGTALTLADSSATAADICPPRDQSLINQMLASAKTERDNAVNALAAVDAEIVNKTNERNTAITVRDNTVASLRALLRGNGASSQIDDRVDPLLNAALSWGNYSYAYEAAVANVSRATEARNTWADKVASYDAMLADSAGSLARLNADIAALDAQIAATSPSDTERLNLLRGQRSGKEAEIRMLESIPQIQTLTNEIAALDAQIATNPPNKVELEKERARKARELDANLFRAARADAVNSLASAQATLNTAIADRDAASSSFGQAQTQYQTTYANLTGAGRYAVYDGNGNVIAYRCTSGCAQGDVNITNDLNSLLWNLFGFPGTTAPSTDATYLKPLKLQKELDALAKKREAAAERATKAQAQVTQMQAMVDNPAACNTTGSAVVPMTPAQAQTILENVDRKGGTR